MLTYYALYDQSPADPPRGICVMDWRASDGLLWDHFAKAWSYDPELIGRLIFDERNLDRIEEIDRTKAEQVTLAVTEGRERLPDEDTIRWIFQWKGDPPQADDRD